MLHGRSKKLQYIGKECCVHIKPSGRRRSMTGKMLVFDDYLNIVLDNAVEKRWVIQKVDGVKMEQEMVRECGLVIIRGTEVLKISFPKKITAGGEGAPVTGQEMRG